MIIFPKRQLTSWYASDEGRRRIDKGLGLARDSNLAVIGIARDCATGLKCLRPQIEQIRSHFRRSFVSIYENDSLDSTKRDLLAWQAASPEIHLQLDQHAKSRKVPSFSEERIARMAACRNRGLELMERSAAASGIKPDYVLMVDWDLRSLPAEGVFAALADANAWDVLTANGLAYRGRGYRRILRGYRYYDTYALLDHDGAQTQEAIFKNWERYSGLRPGQPPLKVKSAFGGAALYRAERLGDHRYGVLPNADPVVETLSEHTYLHRAMAKPGELRLCIHPTLLTFYERPWDVTLGQTLRRWHQSFTKQSVI